MTRQAIAIIQARMSSTRLPGKVMMSLAGKPMIWHIVQRAMACDRVDAVIVATSSEVSDDPIADFCGRNGIRCYRGSLNNVLDRYLTVLEDNPSDFFVRITGDCPLIDPGFIDQQILVLTQYKADQVLLTDPVTVLEGQSVHSTRSLRYIAERTNHPDDLEHVGSRYFAEHLEEFRIIAMEPPEELRASWRVTVDEVADYEMMQCLYNAIWAGYPIMLSEALKWMSEHPEVANHNQRVSQSIINQELAAKRKKWCHQIDRFCVWYSRDKRGS